MNNKPNTTGGIRNPGEAFIGHAIRQTSPGSVGQGAVGQRMGNVWFAMDPTSIMGRVPVGSVGGAPVVIHRANIGVPAQVDEPRETIVLPSANGLGRMSGKGDEVGETLLVKPNELYGLAGGVPTSNGGSCKQQGSSPPPDLSTQGDSFPPSIPSNPAGPSNTPSEGQLGDDKHRKGGKLGTATGGVTKGNASGHGTSKRRPRRYKEAIPSLHCHICSRRAGPKCTHFVCGNILRACCRKVICDKCFAEYKWDINDVRKAGPGEWLCNHCRDECPPRSQCHIYNRTSERRRLKQINHRKKKAGNSSNPNSLAASRSQSTQPTAAPPEAWKDALGSTAGGNPAVQCAPVDPNLGMSAAGLSTARLESISRKEGSEPRAENPQSTGAKGKKKTKRRRNEGQTSKPAKKAKTAPEGRVVLARTKEEFVAQMRKHGGNVREMARDSRAAQQESVQQSALAIPQGSKTPAVGHKNVNPTHSMDQCITVLSSLHRESVPVGNQSIDPALCSTAPHIAHPTSVPQPSVIQSVGHPLAHPLPRVMERTVSHNPSLSQGDMALSIGNRVTDPSSSNIDLRVARAPAIPQESLCLPMRTQFADPTKVEIRQSVANFDSAPHGTVGLPIGNPFTHPNQVNVQQGVAGPQTAPRGIVVLPDGNQHINSVHGKMLHHAHPHPPAIRQGGMALLARNQPIDPAQGNTRQSMTYSHSVPPASAVPIGNCAMDQRHTITQQGTKQPPAPQGNVSLPIGNNAIAPTPGNTQQSVPHVAQASREDVIRQTRSNHAMLGDGNAPPYTSASLAPHLAGAVAGGNSHVPQANDVFLGIDDAIAAAVQDKQNSLDMRKENAQALKGNSSNIPTSAPTDSLGPSSNPRASESLEQDRERSDSETQLKQSIALMTEHDKDEDNEKKVTQLGAEKTGLDGSATQERSEIEALVDSFLVDDMQQVPPLFGTAESVQVQDEEQVDVTGSGEYGEFQLAVNEAFEIPEPLVEDAHDILGDQNSEHRDFLGSGEEVMNLTNVDFGVGSSCLSAPNGF